MRWGGNDGDADIQSNNAKSCGIRGESKSTATSVSVAYNLAGINKTAKHKDMYPHISVIKPIVPHALDGGLVFVITPHLDRAGNL